ncbi:MAG: T9SS type A sorting domain-containing protein [Candidatus Zixiibacteriota bacterium]
MRYLILLLLFFTFQCNAQSISWNWGKAIHGPSNEDEIDALASDNHANVYSSGKFEDTLFFNDYNDTLISRGMADIMLMKYDSTGHLLWYEQFGGTGEDNAFDAVCDSENNLILSGYYQDTIIFDTDTLVSNGGFDAFIIKFDPDGNIIWSLSFGGSEKDGANEVKISTDDRIIATADSYSDFRIDTFNITNTGFRDAYVMSITSSGNIEWYRSIQGAGHARSKSVAADCFGNVFFGGDFYGSNYVNDEHGIPNLLINSGNNDAFLTCWNDEGDLKWFKKWGSSGYEYCKGLTTNNDGEVFACGPFENTVAFDSVSLTSAGGVDYILWKLDSMGDSQWIRQLSSPSDVLGGGELIDDGNQGVALGLGMIDTLTIDDIPGTQQFTIPASSAYPIFLIYDIDGKVVQTLESPYSIYSSCGEIRRSGNYFFLDIMFMGGIILGTETFTTSPIDNKDGILACIHTSVFGIGSDYEPDKPYEIIVYPNPANTQINVDCQTGFQIYNSAGQLVSQSRQATSQINISDLPTGAYIVKTDNSIGRFIKK